jgi:hypothetical protein
MDIVDDRPRGGWPDRFSGSPDEPPENWITDEDRKALDLILDYGPGTVEEFEAITFETELAEEVRASLDAAVKALNELEEKAEDIRSQAVTD